ncbi:hypothetical protein JEM65_07910 [Gelidibacter salicanalis]|uniref:UDP-glycosyltransferase n=1 Tax=Gelidibacter salicanalis TaxID=291193 RepID=A0A934KSG0_9FLAO|nr:hypothetical protein [Gelidibacter salicanalis]
MEKKIGLVITDGVGFRNFILSNCLQEIEGNFGEVIIYSCIPKEVFEGFSSKTKVIELDVFPDRFRTWFFMKLKEVAHLRLHKEDNFGISYNYDANKSTTNTPRGFAVRLIYAITEILHSEKWIQIFNYWQQLSFKNHKATKSYLEIFARDQIDFMFFTHQRPQYIAPLIYAAEKLNIPTGTFIFSWDNLASKGRMAGNFKHYFVWSQLMKMELLEFYNTILPNRIHVVGTPQFEPYVLDRYKISKQDFSHKFHLNKQLKTICFSCGDVSTSKNDPLYIETIAMAIQSQKINQKANFLVRTSPAETAERVQYLRDEFPFIVWNYPDWPLSREGHQEIWSQRVPTVGDMIDLRGILEHCDVFINMCSTMSLDAMCFNKAVINPVFGNIQNGLYNDQRFLKFAHYKRVVESGAVAIVKNEKDLIDEINKALSEPTIRIEAQQELLQLQVSCQLMGTSERIAKTIKACL